MAQRTVLVGGGHAHMAVLHDWARLPPIGEERVLISRASQTAYSGMLPGWMVGHYRAQELLIDLVPLARRAGARLVIDAASGLDLWGGAVLLASGVRLEYDLLSLAAGGEADLAPFAALGDRALPLRPFDLFMRGWERLLAQHRIGRPVTLAVVGGGAAGVEAALAAEAVLRGGGASVALITSSDGLLPGHGAAARRMVCRELLRRGIALHLGRAEADCEGLRLADGTRIAASHVIVATGSVAPPWLAQSGLAITEEGFMAIGADLRSISHNAIFGAGDIAQRVDRQLPRSGVHAVKAGPVLAANLRAASANLPLAQYRAHGNSLYLMATGERRAIGSWGQMAFRGRLAWWLKSWIDRRFVAAQCLAGRDDNLR